MNQPNQINLNQQQNQPLLENIPQQQHFGIQQGHPIPQVQYSQQYQQYVRTNAHGEMHSTKIQCCTCHQISDTYVSVNSVTYASLLWCFLGACFCCFIPSCCPDQSEYTHYCTKCGAIVGKKSADCCCK